MDQAGEVAPSPVPSEKTPPIESVPENVPDKQPETRPSRGIEQGGTAINQAPQAAQVAPLTLPPVVESPKLPTPPATAPAATPVIADDVDVIEKEWVDKARKIVNQTKDDPHQQEQAVEQLQRDYLKARYNKDLGSSPN